MVDLEKLTKEDLNYINQKIENHTNNTQSKHSQKCINDWQAFSKHFVKLMPIDYKYILQHNTFSKSKT